MGLALDELENSKDTVSRENGIPIVYDDRLKQYLKQGSVTVDFRETSYGSGFIVNSGSSC